MSIKPYKNELEEKSTNTIKPFKQESSCTLDTSLEFLETKEVAMKKNVSFIGSIGSVFLGIFIFCFLAVFANTILSIQNTLDSKNIADYIYLGGLLLLFVTLLLFTCKNIKEYLALQKINTIKDNFKAQKKSPNADIIPLAYFIINKYDQEDNEELKGAVENLKKELNSSIIYQNIYDNIDNTILASIDKLAKKSIHKASIQGALATAISPIPMIDMALILWRSTLLAKDIASLYGFKPGLTTTLILLKRGAINIMFAGISELANEFANQATSSSFLAKASRSLGQGAINGILIARLGYGVLEACRPIESNQGKTSFFKMLFHSIKEVLKS